EGRGDVVVVGGGGDGGDGEPDAVGGGSRGRTDRHQATRTRGERERGEHLGGRATGEEHGVGGVEAGELVGSRTTFGGAVRLDDRDVDALRSQPVGQGRRRSVGHRQQRGAVIVGGPCRNQPRRALD